METKYNNYNEKIKDNDPQSLVEILSENYHLLKIYIIKKIIQMWKCF